MTYIKNKYLVVRDDIHYEVKMDRIKTEDDLEWWIDHISEKNWSSTFMLNNIRRIVHSYWKNPKQKFIR